MKCYNKKDKTFVFFVDFKSAYNCVDRDILYQIIIREQILNKDETFFLKFLHSLVYFDVEGQRYHL